MALIKIRLMADIAQSGQCRNDEYALVMEMIIWPIAFWMKKTRNQCRSLFTTMKNSQERGRSLFDSSACSECMILHCDRPALFSPRHQCWRGSQWITQLHQKRPIKRASVAGIALRAELLSAIFSIIDCSI
ncbi:hypothetical protein DXU84_16665 [Rahnella sp. RcJ3]|nr:hypothetical protein [Rahnella sp. RcJ3]